MSALSPRLKILVTAALVVALGGCMGYVPGRQSYWDAKVKEMCERDGGVTVYETIELSEREYRDLGGTHGALPIPDVKKDKTEYPYVSSITETKIREANPQVVRTEEMIARRSDGKVLAKSVSYSRRGGDIPTGLAHDSSFRCPEYTLLSRSVFKVTGVSR